jgi:cyclohexanecarboxylate-CoA ligase
MAEGQTCASEAAMTDSAARYRRGGWWRDQTFLDDLRRNARDQPGKPVLTNYRGHSDQPHVLTYAELARLTSRYSSALVRLGLQRGDVVAVQLPNWWEIAPLGLACAQAGALICLLRPAYRRHELEQILRVSGARLCITLAEWDGARLADTVLDLARELPGLEHVVVAGGGQAAARPTGTLDFAEFSAAEDGGGEDGGGEDGGGEDGGTGGGADRALGPDEPFLILFTSGTTGPMKGVVHSQNTLYSGCRAYAGPLGLDGSSVIFVAHVATYYTGFVLGMLLPVLLGGSGLVQQVWDADLHLSLSQRHGVTNFYGAPHALAELIAAQRGAPRDLSRLRSIVTGSAPVPPHVVEQATTVLGARVHTLWGMTENGTVTITRQQDPPGWAAHSDGSPVDGMELRIDPLTVPGGGDGSGRLWVRGANQCLGYFGRDDLYAASLDTGGWFDTGDLVRDDGRGGIRITGRIKDLVIHRATNVPVTDVEGVLARHPNVGEVAIIGIPHNGGIDELVCAVVAPQGAPPGLAALRDHLADAGVAELYWPERLELVDTLPKTITGKVRKAELRERFGAQ